jgi:uncharacterized protein YbjQ (UPF0145 family)
MIVVTTPFVAGHRVRESKGMVFGLVVRSRGLGGNIMAGLRSLGGGETILQPARGHPPAGSRPARQNATCQTNAILSMHRRFELSGAMSKRWLRDRSHRRRASTPAVTAGVRRCAAQEVPAVQPQSVGLLAISVSRRSPRANFRRPPQRLAGRRRHGHDHRGRPGGGATAPGPPIAPACRSDRAVASPG